MRASCRVQGTLAEGTACQTTLRWRGDALQRLMDVQETAEYLDVQPDELQGWADEDLIPHAHAAGPLIFRLREIVRWGVEGRLRLGAPQGAEQ